MDTLRKLIKIRYEQKNWQLWRERTPETTHALRRVAVEEAQLLAGVTDPETGLHFPDFNASPFGGEEFQTNLILPEPAEFLRTDLPAVSVIRPTSTEHAGAVAAVNVFTDDKLFAGQSDEFFGTLMKLAKAADAAHREP
jgi:hypothetical protein